MHPRRGELGVAVPDQEPEGAGALAEVHQEVAGLLRRPRAVRVGGDAEQVHAAGAVLDDEQGSTGAAGSAVSTWKKSAARIAAGLGGRNCRQVGPGRRGAGSIPASCRICHTVEAAIGWPSLTSSPCTRRCPHAGFSVAIRITSFRIAAGVDGRPGRRRLV